MPERTQDLHRTIAELTSRVDALARENAELRARLARYETPKNSSNSSIPPSRDEHRAQRTASLRERSGRRPGGQAGHDGNTLRMVETPDAVSQHTPEYCHCCGEDLRGIPQELVGRRQVVDIPEVRARVTEHQVFKRTCPCGHTMHGSYPSGVEAPVGYGPRIEALAGYLHARQYVPFARMQELMNDAFGVGISEGGLHRLINRLAGKVSPIYEQIRERVQGSPVVGSDETGAKVNGKNHWFWAWQTPRLTYIAHSESRGMKAIDASFPGGFPSSTLVSDAWRAQLNTVARHHQCCLSHLQRNLKYLNELYVNNRWGNRFLKLLYESLELKRAMAPSDYIGENPRRDRLLEQFHSMLAKPPSRKQQELYTLFKRVLRDKQRIFTFLFIPEVPPDNNASERAIRNVKVKQKVSGQFKVAKAAQNFAKIRSVIDTIIKNNLSVMEGLWSIAIT